MLDHHPLTWYMSHRICRCNFSVEATNHRSSLKIGDDWIRTGAALSQNQKVQLLRTSSGPHPLLNSVLVFSCQSWVVNDILDFQVANLGRLFRVPQVSYLSTSVTFCNREKFPFFFRTVPSDLHQVGRRRFHIILFVWCDFKPLKTWSSKHRRQIYIGIIE